MPLHKDDPRMLGGYRIVDRLGAGGMGVVYRARSRSGREVALKVVHAQYAEDAVFRARFRQEIEAVRKVSGAFTAPVVDVDPEAARPWMATQYVPGRSLADRIREGGPIRGAEVRLVALGLVEALRDIHRAGVVHRDLKPANVLMAEDGPRVIDFGISRAAENHNTLTETGQMIGTPPFMSPEQFTDARSVGPASDVFSLGALLAYSLTGRGPFDADSPYLTAYRVVHHEPVLEGVARPLRTVLERCLAKEAKERPGLDELAHAFASALPEPTGDDDPPTLTLRPVALRAAAETDPGHAVDRTAVTTGSGRRRRRTRPVWAAIGTVGALALGTLGYMWYGPGFPDDAPPVSSASSRPSATSAASGRAALPAGWKPWQTTVRADAERGLRKAPDTKEAATAPFCAMDGGALYCGGSALLPERIDGATGGTVWRADIAPAGVSPDLYVTSVFGVHDGVVLVELIVDREDGGTQVQAVLGLDSDTGETLWSRNTHKDGLGSVSADGLALMEEGDGRSLTARSASDGAQRWKLSLPTGYSCTPTSLADRLYVECATQAENSDDSQVLVVDPTDGSTERVTSLNANDTLVGALDGQLVFVESVDEGPFVDGDVTYRRILRVDPADGKREVTALTGTFKGTVVMRHDTLWFVTLGGRVSAVDPATGIRKWESGTDLESPGDVTVDDEGSTVYLATTSGRTAALDAAKGTPLWQSDARAEVLASGLQPAVLVNKGAVVVVTADGTVFTLDPADPDRTPVSAG
ncbi:serine/threonine-protein kinase [Streptomyces sp. NBC_00582]|uniref:serine/threonine-protein kinase n=1 Tax=Streptomyces sp. NBC_00582 TaxID=2975783 RepID=UPI002E803BBB|nr:serine/threonine-protein kinase [Streptomyces sp. NBC_00582]WUB65274.1 PQQ-binding-like beta-propeller repeat protein [Streptomyces sp. NBC_00582]